MVPSDWRKPEFFALVQAPCTGDRSVGAAQPSAPSSATVLVGDQSIGEQSEWRPDAQGCRRDLSWTWSERYQPCFLLDD
jgi:hypothetical protein